MEKMFSIPISRRDFMKMTGLAAAGVLAVNTVGMPETVLASPAGGAHGTIKYSGKEIPVLYSVDVCVAGGGPSGTAAAIMAARNGAKTLLIERGVALGGLAVLGCVYPFMDTHAPDSDTPYVAEVKNRLRKHGIEPFDGVTQQTWHNPETLALIYDEMCEEAGVEILYQTVLVDTVRSGHVIEACIVQTIAGLAAIRARTFIDSTGDAFLSRSAGVPSERGYEKTGNNQPLSCMWQWNCRRTGANPSLPILRSPKPCTASSGTSWKNSWRKAWKAVKSHRKKRSICRPIPLSVKMA